MEEQDFPGTFIVIEGLDAAGKATQAEMLSSCFEESGEEVKQVEFPSYGTPFSQLVEQYLDGELGDKEDLPMEIRSLLYSLDRYQFKEEFLDFLDSGGVLVADRYSQSNFAFQSATVEDPEEMVEWMRSVDSRLPQPDEVFFLDLPPGKAAELMEDREKDVHERDLSFQKKVYDRYKKIAQDSGWTIIDCVSEGEIRSREDIHQDIWNAVSDN